MTADAETTLNVFEAAILTRMADQFPPLLTAIPELRVTSRRMTGAGSYTNFGRSQALPLAANENPLALDAHILMPEVTSGLGAMLFFKLNRTAFLEIFTYGDDFWSGDWTGYSIEGAHCSY